MDYNFISFADSHRQIKLDARPRMLILFTNGLSPKGTWNSEKNIYQGILGIALIVITDNINLCNSTVFLYLLPWTIFKNHIPCFYL